MDTFEAIVEQLSDGVLLIRDGKITYVNAICARWAGQAAAGLRGNSAEDFLSRLKGRGSSGTSSQQPELEVLSRAKLGADGAELVIIRDASALRGLERQLGDFVNMAEQRVSRELHDGIGQELAALGFQAKALESSPGVPPVALAAIAELRAHLQEATDHLRRVAHGLEPPPREHSLKKVLERFTRKISVTYPVRCTFVSGDSDPAWPAESVHHLQRIVQEAVSNSIKHGRAQNVIVSLERGETEFVLKVDDDGRGTSQAEGSGSGIGLRIMEHRARAVGAKFRFAHKSAGSGAVVECRIPWSSPV